MGYNQTELSRFTGSGKTFFLNKGRAKNGTDYLAINALYGQGKREGLVLFSAHYLEFLKHLTAAVEELTGMTARKAAPATGCTKCSSKHLSVRRTLEDDYYLVFCKDCRELIFETEEGRHGEKGADDLI